MKRRAASHEETIYFSYHYIQSLKLRCIICTVHFSFPYASLVARTTQGPAYSQIPFPGGYQTLSPKHSI